MTRKDYIKLADMLAQVRKDRGGLAAVENKLVKILADDNPRFDEQKFRAAANLRYV